MDTGEKNLNSRISAVFLLLGMISIIGNIIVIGVCSIPIKWGDFMYNEGIGAAFAVLGGFIFIVLIIGFILYILKSFGLYRLAARANIENAWLSWIPIGDAYIMAKLAGDVSIGSMKISNNYIVLPVGAALVAFLPEIPVLSNIIVVAYMILFLITLYKLYKNYRPDNAVLWIVLSIIFGFLIPIFLFIIREDEPTGI